MDIRILGNPLLQMIDQGQLVASYPKKFSQVSLIDRAPQLHFFTLENTELTIILF